MAFNLMYNLFWVNSFPQLDTPALRGQFPLVKFSPEKKFSPYRQFLH